MPTDDQTPPSPTTEEVRVMCEKIGRVLLVANDLEYALKAATARIQFTTTIGKEAGASDDEAATELRRMIEEYESKRLTMGQLKKTWYALAEQLVNDVDPSKLPAVNWINDRFTDVIECRNKLAHGDRSLSEAPRGSAQMVREVTAKLEEWECTFSEALGYAIELATATARPPAQSDGPSATT